MSGPSSQVGRYYRVRRSFDAMRDNFVEGELLIYESSAYSRYDGIAGYFFKQVDQVGSRWWDVPDDQPADLWLELFEAMDPPPA
ncbi:hypothetical protein DFR24_1334 [Panacagrimonas perspica]|uniref:Uncharacterized protein n=1 Tax=Panacagrimonas perspica TaxID=381431 RepID=A0A4S3K7R7_9GAMM|nr:hypothetical protein [Panacagrimonas perspica]TDU31950.1 hypothetical protein DFR24_1334 [Panacagrimonas perspica]THD04265.1 hypothetical protein B1810_06435 [Panacagrimonas perspica]